MAHTGTLTPGADALERIKREVRKEMVDVANDLAEAAAKDAPRLDEAEHRERHGDEPHLADSVEVTVRKVRNKNRVEAEVRFPVFYAAWLHEEMQWKHPRGGRAKYLMVNTIAMVAPFRRRLAAASRRALDDG